MKTIEEVLNRGSHAFDGRDFSRLAQFMTPEQVETYGMGFNTPEQRAAHVPIEWNEANIKKQLQGDLAFAFEKALDQRGISASCMYEVIRMWNFVLGFREDNENEDSAMYAQYGLPYLKATALHYGFPNEIGEDNGNESKYGE